MGTNDRLDRIREEAGNSMGEDQGRDLKEESLIISRKGEKLHF